MKVRIETDNGFIEVSQFGKSATVGILDQNGKLLQNTTMNANSAVSVAINLKQAATIIDAK